MDLGKWLKNRKDQAVRQWQDSVILDAVSSNTKADQQRRMSRGQPRFYAQQQAQRPRVQAPLKAPQANNGINSRIFDQLNPYDNGRTFKQRTPTNSRSIASQQFRDFDAVSNAIARSTVGAGQDLGGAYDLLTPGEGVNRFTKQMKDYGGLIDENVKKKGLSTGLYRTAQVPHQAGMFWALGEVGAAPFKAAGKIPGVAKAGQPIVNAAGKISQLADDGNKIAKVARYAGNPQRVVNVGVDAIQNAGNRTSKGQDNNVGTAIIDTGLSIATQGALDGGGKVVNKYVAEPVKEALRNKNVIRPSKLNDYDVADLVRFRQTMGNNMDEGIYSKGVAAQPGGIRERIQIAKENVNSVINGSPDALPANQVVRNPAVFDAVMDKMKQLENPDAYTTAELNEMNQVLFDASKETGIPFLQGSREQQKQTLAQFQEMNAEALQNPQTTLRDRIRSAKDKIKPLGNRGSVPADSPLLPLNKLIKDDPLEPIKQEARNIQATIESPYLNSLPPTQAQSKLAGYRRRLAEINKQLNANDTALNGNEPKFERDINTGKMKMQSSNKQVSKDRYSIANSDIARTKSTGMNQDGFTVEDWGGKKRYVSLDDASPETKMKVRKAEAEFEAAKKANNGTALAAKQKVNDAYSDAINDLNLQDYATTDSGTRTFNSRYNDWLETKYKDRNVDTATIKDMAANPQKYRQQFEAETSQPIGEVAQQPTRPRTQLTGKQLDVPSSMRTTETTPPPFLRVSQEASPQRLGSRTPDVQESRPLQTPQPQLKKQSPLTYPDNTPDIGEKQLDEIYNKTLKDKETKKAFEAKAKEYLGNVEAAKITAEQKALSFKRQFDLSDDEAIDVIRTADSGLESKNPKVNQASADLRKTYDNLYNYFTKERGIDMGYQHDYYPRQYVNKKTGDKITTAEYDLLMAGSSRQKGRTSDLLQEWKLVTKDPGEALKMYYDNLERAASGKKFLNDLEKNGLVVKGRGEPVRGMRPIIAEGLQNSDGSIYYAKKEVADKLNTMFGSKEATNAVEQILEKGAGLNSFWQSVVLSGGIPNTPINAFGFMQIMKEGMALHPIKAGKALYGGLSKDFSQKYFEKKAPTMALMAKEGIATRYSLSDGAKKGMGRVTEAFDEKGVGKGINQAWNELTNDSTFSRFMPILEVEHFDNVYKQGLKRNLSPKEAARIAGESTKNFYGIRDLYSNATRSKVADNASGAILFAPRFRESMLNFWGKNAKALDPRGGFKNIRSKEYRDNAKFLVSAAVMYAGYDALNYELNGTHLWENPDGKKDKLLIPGVDPGGKTLGIPFLPSIATVPRNAAGLVGNLATGNFGEAGKNLTSFGSMPLRTAGELLTNQNYFGQQIVDPEAPAPQRLTQGGAYVARSTMQPWMREGLNLVGQGLPEGVKDAFGIKKKSGLETVSNALEAPVRFYDPKYMKGGKQAQKQAEVKGKATGNSLTKDEALEIQKKEYDGKYADFTEKELKELAKEDATAGQYLKSLKATKKAFSDDPELPDGIDASAEKVLITENRLTDEGKAKWNKKESTDTNIKSDLTSRLPKDVEAPTITNEIAKEWANLKKKQADGTLGKLEEESEYKSILRKAYNSNLNEDERDLYSLSKEKLQDAYDRGVINDDNINKALAVEKQLFDAGLINKETLANKLGLVARGYKGRSGGRGGRGSTAKDTSRTEINNLSLDTFSKLNQLLAGTTAKKSAPKRVVAQKAVTKKITVKA
jgi:hypothetical protein